MSWHTGTLAAFDLETTGVDLEHDRIVTACVVAVDGSDASIKGAANWLVNPGIDIPAQASAIHGITTAQARTKGEAPQDAIPEIVTKLIKALRIGAPIVGFNVSFDLTLLDRECRRYGMPTLSDLVDQVAPVVCARVLDKHVSFRKGNRKLIDCCRHWGVKLAEADAHQAHADAWAACGIAVRIAQRTPSIARRSLMDLHEQQIEWHREQCESYAQYLRRQATQASHVDDQLDLHARAQRVEAEALHWPIAPYEQQGALT